MRELQKGAGEFPPYTRFVGIHRDGAYVSELMASQWIYLFPIGELELEHATPLPVPA